MQALYLCIACEEPFDVGMPIPEDAIVFDGVITDEPPPYYFVLSKPSTKLKYPENRSFDRINDAEIVIVDLTTGIRDTLQNAKLTGYQDFRFYDHYRDKDVTVYMKWLPGETPGGLYVTNKIYGVENHTYELHIKYKGKEYTACERMVPKTPIDKIVMKRIDTGYLVQSVRHILFQQDNESYRICTYRDKKRRCYWKSNALRSHQPEKRIYQSRYPHHRNFTRYAVFTAPSSMQHTRKRQNGYINGELLIVWRNSGTRC